MAARHGTISPTLRAGVPFWGGLGGGGGWRLLCALTHAGGGSPVGAPSGMAEKTRWRPLGSWAPSRKNLGFAGGDSAYGMVWYGMVCCCCCCCEGTQHVPAGEIARHALPGQGAREQSAGVTLAGRVPTTTEGGGGGAVEWRGGGRRAWRRVGPPVEVTLAPSPVSRGESYSSCAKRLWWGWRAGRCPWGGEGTPGSTDTPRLWYGMVWYGMVWYGMVWYGMVWYGMVWYGMVWYGMVWYGMVWYGMVWYGIIRRGQAHTTPPSATCGCKNTGGVSICFTAPAPCGSNTRHAYVASGDARPCRVEGSTFAAHFAFRYLDRHNVELTLFALLLLLVCFASAFSCRESCKCLQMFRTVVSFFWGGGVYDPHKLLDCRPQVQSRYQCKRMREMESHLQLKMSVVAHEDGSAVVQEAVVVSGD